MFASCKNQSCKNSSRDFIPKLKPKSVQSKISTSKTNPVLSTALKSFKRKFSVLKDNIHLSQPLIIPLHTFKNFHSTSNLAISASDPCKNTSKSQKTLPYFHKKPENNIDNSEMVCISRKIPIKPLFSARDILPAKGSLTERNDRLPKRHQIQFKLRLNNESFRKPIYIPNGKVSLLNESQTSSISSSSIFDRTPRYLNT